MFGGLSSPGCSFQETFLYQEWFINFFNSSAFFSYGCGNCGEAYWSSAEFIYDGRKYPVIHFIKSMLVDVQCLQSVSGNIKVYLSGAFNLCKVAYSS